MSKNRKQNDNRGLPDEVRDKIAIRAMGTSQTLDEISESFHVHPKTVAKICRIYMQARDRDFSSMVRECVKNNNTADVRWACDRVGVHFDED